MTFRLGAYERQCEAPMGAFGRNPNENSINNSRTRNDRRNAPVFADTLSRCSDDGSLCITKRLPQEQERPAERTIKSAWEMVCFPQNGKPYHVRETDDQQLVITSASGVKHRYEVVSNRDIERGFAMVASDGDRTLHVSFEKGGGSLSANGLSDNCSPAR
jgi:hypothetical protein